jgi:hypothetical protein
MTATLAAAVYRSSMTAVLIVENRPGRKVLDAAGTAVWRRKIAQCPKGYRSANGAEPRLTVKST